MVFFHFTIHILALSPVEITPVVVVVVVFIYSSSKNSCADPEVGPCDIKMESTWSQISREVQSGGGQQAVH